MLGLLQEYDKSQREDRVVGNLKMRRMRSLYDGMAVLATLREHIEVDGQSKAINDEHVLEIRNEILPKLEMMPSSL